MRQVVVILTEDGAFDNVFSDSETDVSILKRGTDDRQIDTVEHELFEVELAK